MTSTKLIRTGISSFYIPDGQITHGGSQNPTLSVEAPPTYEEATKALQQLQAQEMRT